jgi:hypothetical protein
VEEPEPLEPANVAAKIPHIIQQPAPEQPAPVQPISHMAFDEQKVPQPDITSSVSPVSPISPVESVSAAEPVSPLESGTSMELPLPGTSPKRHSEGRERSASIGSESVYSIASNDDSPSYPEAKDAWIKDDDTAYTSCASEHEDEFEEEEPVIIQQGAQAMAPQVITRAKLVTIPKRIPPALPPRSPARKKIVNVDPVVNAPEVPNLSATIDGAVGQAQLLPGGAKEMNFTNKHEHDTEKVNEVVPDEADTFHSIPSTPQHERDAFKEEMR